MKKCLLFDNDGTLVDSERLCNVAMAIKFRELGIDLDADALVIRFRGWKLARILELLTQEHQVSLPTGFVENYRSLVSQLFESDLKPVDGIHAALDQLDHPMAVVSSGPRFKIKQALRACGLEKYFGDNLYSSYEVGIWKPDPGIYLHAARDMGFSVQDCVVIDDGPVGVEAGVGAGIRTLFYNRFDEPCEFPGVVSFGSMADLPRHIDGDQAALF